jgi:hypothetical protein
MKNDLHSKQSSDSSNPGSEDAIIFLNQAFAALGPEIFAPTAARPAPRR